VNFGFQRVDGSNAFQGSGVRGHFFGQSSFASHCLATERNAVKISRDLPLDLLAPLGCGIQTGAGTVMNYLAVPKRASIAVFGTGAVGLAAVMAAHIVGAIPIIGVDIFPSRLKLALDLGATHGIDSGRQEVASRIREITGGGVDYVLEITGDPEMNQIAAEVLNRRGTVALIANPNGPASLPGGRKAIPIIEGGALPQQFLPKLTRLFRAGRFPLDRLVKFYTFGRIHQAIRDAKKGKTVKPVVRMGGAQGG
jgi:aryl-alcohol dehydrogenase